LNVMINVKSVTDRQFVASKVAELDELLSQASAATEACDRSVRKAMS
jgi:formiminotetrahydrofolate cyclodeaminase